MFLCVGEWKWQRHPYTQWRNELNIKTPTNNSIKLKSHQFPIVFSVCHLFQQTHRAYPLFIFRRLIAVYNAIFAVERHTHTQNIGRQKRQIRRRRVSITTATASTPIFRLTFIAWIFARSQFSHSLIPWISGRPVPPLLTNSRHAIIFRARYFKFYTNSKAFPTQSVRLIKTRNINGSVYLVGIVGWLCIRQYFVVFSPTIAHWHHPHHYYYHHHQQHHSVESTLSLSLCIVWMCVHYAGRDVKRKQAGNQSLKSI